MPTRLAVRNMPFSLQFNGTSTRIQIPYSASLDQVNGFTWSMYVLTQNPAANARLIRHNINGWNLYNGDTVDYGLTWFFPPSMFQFMYRMRIQPEWTLVTVTYDKNLPSANLKYYRNGVLVNSITNTTTTLTSSPAEVIRIGAEDTFNYYKGYITHIRNWNTALTAAQVESLYRDNIIPREGLCLEYLFENGTGSTAIDTSGNNNNGTITGANYSTFTPFKIRNSV